MLYQNVKESVVSGPLFCYRQINSRLRQNKRLCFLIYGCQQNGAGRFAFLMLESTVDETADFVKFL